MKGFRRLAFIVNPSLCGQGRRVLPLAFLCEDNMEMNVTLCNNILSKWILKYPEQWLWLTDRWAWTLGTARS